MYVYIQQTFSNISKNIFHLEMKRLYYFIQIEIVIDYVLLKQYNPYHLRVLPELQKQKKKNRHYINL